MVKSLVEAAGVEPASEKVRRAKPTCVSGSAFQRPPVPPARRGGRLARLISALGYEQKPGAYPAK